MPEQSLENMAIENIIERAKKENNPEIPKSFKTVVVLGAGMQSNLDDKTIKLSLDSKIRALAGGLIANEGKADKLILAGGKTAGPDYHSEAEYMKKYLLKKFPRLENFSIITEDVSFDTIENAKKVAQILKNNNFGEEGPILLITNGYHILRAINDFTNQGIQVEAIPAENIVGQRSGHHEKFIQEYLASSDTKKRQAIEWLLRGLTAIDPEGKILTPMARLLRHGENID